MSQVAGQVKSPSDRPFDKPPSLELRLDDTFEQNTLSNFDVRGGVEWNQGEVFFKNQGTLVFDLSNSDSWIELNLDLKFNEPSDVEDETQLMVWLDFSPGKPKNSEGGVVTRDSCVWFRQIKKDGKTRSFIGFVSNNDNWDQPKSPVNGIRKPYEMEGPLENGKWKIVHRNGHWKVISPSGKENFHAYSLFSTPKNIALIGDEIHLGSLQVRSTSAWDPSGQFLEEWKLKSAHLETQKKQLAGQSNLKEMVKLEEEIIALKKEIYGKWHPGIAVRLNLLAVQYMHLNLPETAEAKLREALAIHKKNVGTEHPDYATTLDNFGGSLQVRGDTSTAEPIFRKAYETRKQLFGTAHPYVAVSQNNLAIIYSDLGDLDRAEALLLESKETRKKLPDRSDYAYTLENLGGLYEKRGNYEAAVKYSREALAIREELAPQSLEHASSLNNVGYLLTLLGQHKEAMKCLLAGRDLRENSHEGKVSFMQIAYLASPFVRKTWDNWNKRKRILQNHLPSERDS